jgi:hypothetical protein
VVESLWDFGLAQLNCCRVNNSCIEAVNGAVLPVLGFDIGLCQGTVDLGHLQIGVPEHGLHTELAFPRFGGQLVKQ